MQGAGGLIGETRGGTSKYYHADALGTTRAITNSSQTKTDSLDTDAFGMSVAVTGSTPTPFGFAGQHGYQNDSVTGLMRLGHRYYDASVGRFLSRDPIQDGYNWYTYVGNDPVNGVDPEGLAKNEVLPIIRRAINEGLLPPGTANKYQKDKDFKERVHRRIGKAKTGNGKKTNPDLDDDEVIDIVHDELPKEECEEGVRDVTWEIVWPFLIPWRLIPLPMPVRIPEVVPIRTPVRVP